MRLPLITYKIIYTFDIFLIAFFTYKYFLEKYYLGHLLWIFFFAWNATQCKKYISREKKAYRKIEK